MMGLLLDDFWKIFFKNVLGNSPRNLAKSFSRGLFLSRLALSYLTPSGLLLALLLGLVPFSVSAEEEPLVKVNLLAFDSRICQGKGAENGELGAKLRMVMQEGWHIYGPEVGEFGLPTSFELRSEEFELLQSEISWPQEQPFEQLGGIQSSGYGGELELVLPLRCLPQDLLLQPHQGGGAAEQGELVLRWLACSASSCVPGEARMTLGPQ